MSPSTPSPSTNSSSHTTDTPAPTHSAWRMPQSKWANWLERISLFFEKPINRLTGTNQLNPLYHTGTIASFLLMVVGVTGVYLFLFFQYGFDASYNAVMRIEANGLGHLLRAVHNYASGALVITVILHAYRMLFMERFRGPRWLAWSTGVFMASLVWLAGITGYWLIWDERAQLLNESFARLLETLTPWADNFRVYVVIAARNDTNWPLLMVLFAAHVILFIITAVFFWLHLRRLNRAQWLPNEYWAVGMGLVLFIAAILFPLGLLAQANPDFFPAQIRLDPIFLFFLPFTNTAVNLFIWIFLAVGGLALTTLPFWLHTRKRINAESGKKESYQPALINIIDENCTGCTLCAIDCPYGALKMVERADDTRHKLIAVADPGLCVSCGICVGSCKDDAIALGENSPDILWNVVENQIESLTQQTNPRIAFICERHAGHGARSYLTADGHEEDTQVIVVPCAGAIPPALLTKGVDEGVQMRVVGCPADDCVNREGNIWMAERIMRHRLPRLNREYVDAPITAVWTAPNEFARALNAPLKTKEDGGKIVPDYLASRRLTWPITWRNYGAALALLAIIMLAQILLTRLPFNLYPDEPTAVQIVIPDPAVPYGYYLNEEAIASGDTTISLAVDGETVFTQKYDPAAVLSDKPEPIYTHIKVERGERAIQLLVVNGDETLTLFDKSVNMEPRAILNLGTTRDLRITSPTPQEK